MRVLVADDDPVVRQFVEASFQSLGHRVVSFPDGLSAFNALGSFDPNLVVSDWKMPGVDGLELCRRIRANQGPTTVYFVLISSAFGECQSGMLAQKAGVDRVLPKPMSVSQLCELLSFAEARAC